MVNECPKFYIRYVADTFFLASPLHRLFCCNYINSKHHYIEFMCDMENNGSIPFLDVIVTRDNRLQTAMYRKLTFTGLDINCLSVIPQLFELNAIKTF